MTIFSIDIKEEIKSPVPTLNLTLNVVNGIIHLLYLELFIIVFRDSRIQVGQSIESGQIARMYRQAWLYTGDKY